MRAICEKALTTNFGTIIQVAFLVTDFSNDECKLIFTDKDHCPSEAEIKAVEAASFRRFEHVEALRNDNDDVKTITWTNVTFNNSFVTINSQNNLRDFSLKDSS